jgi:hypothetical protein
MLTPLKPAGMVVAVAAWGVPLSHTIKMRNAAIFTREGATLAYEQLSDVYTRMDVEYGTRIDVFVDPPKRLFVWWKERGLEDKVWLKHYLNY